MTTSLETTLGNSVVDAPPQRRLITGALLVLALGVVGLLYVKWAPYYAKTLIAAAHHTLGPSIVSGKTAAPPPATLTAALSYARAYYLAIWQALLLALLLGATIQVFFPRRWIVRYLGSVGARSAALGGVLSLAGMMCTCCTAPVVIGLRRQNASLGASMAFFVGNPTLNPATLLFIGFVLSWKFAVLRLVLGVLLIVALAWYANRNDPDARSALTALAPSPIEDPQRNAGQLAVAWVRSLWWELYTILPGYVIIVLLLGATRIWLFSPVLTLANGSIIAIVALAVAGTLFVIPTAGEVPILQTLITLGMSTAPAATLLMTLPAISLPSAFMVRQVVPKNVLLVALAAVCAAGLLAALFAQIFIAK